MADKLFTDEEIFGGSVSQDPQFREFVKKQEGYTPTPQWDYKQRSVGYGTRYRPGDPNTREFHEQRLTEELAQAERLVDQFKPDLPPGPKKALVDLTYNAGTSWQNAGLGKAVLAGNYAEAEQRFLQYNKAGGKPLQGLINRRRAMAPELTGNNGPLLSDDEVFGGAPSQQGPPPLGAFDEGLFPDPRTAQPKAPKSLASGPFPDPRMAPTPAALPQGQEAVPTVDPVPESEKPGGFTRGIVSGFMKENPENFADSLEALSYLSPMGGESLRKGADYVRGIAKKSPAAYATENQGLWNIKDWDSATTYITETIGQGLASSAPAIALGTVGAAGGAAVGGPVGAGVGAVGGALTASAAMQMGEPFKVLKEEGIDPERAAKIAAAVTPVLAGLDAVTPVGLVAKVGGIKEVKREATRHIARRILAGAGTAGLAEGTTEAAQEAVVIATKSLETGQDFWTTKNAMQMTEAAVGGFLPGTVMGGVAGVKRDIPAAPPEADDVINVYRDLVNRTPPPQADPGPTAVPEAQPTPPEPGIQFGSVQSAPADVVASEAAPQFYSTLRRVAEEKLPEAGTPEQMLATLRGKVREEEIVDLGVEEWMRKQGGKIKKADLLEHLTDNAIQVGETVYAPAAELEEGERYGATYGRYITPGPKEAYREIVMKVPVESGEQGFMTEHYTDPNIVSTARLTHRTDVHGVPVVHLEEIQSDTHQQGARLGYAGQVPTYESASAEFKNEGISLNVTWGTGTRPDRYTVHRWGRSEEGLVPEAELSPRLQDMLSRLRSFAEESVRRPLSPRRVVPNLPFKKSWDDLAIKRMIRWAADKGISRITLAPGREQVRRYPGMNNPQGLAKYYDNVLPNKMKSQIKKLGGTWGTTKIDGGADTPYFYVQPVHRDIHGELAMEQPERLGPYMTLENAQAIRDVVPGSFITQELGPGAGTQEVFYIDIPAEAATEVREKGLPLYSQPGPEVKVSGNDQFIVVADRNLKGHTLLDTAHAGIKALYAVADSMDLQQKVRFAIYSQTTLEAVAKGKENEYAYVTRMPDANGRYTIAINLAVLNNSAEMWSSLTHEFGHLIVFDKFKHAPQETQAAILAAYEKWKTEHKNSRYTDMIVARDSIHGPRMAQNLPIAGLGPTTYSKKDEYWMNFDEFMAEQFARYASTSVVPLTIVDKFFDGMAKFLIKLHQEVYNKLGLTFRAEPVIAEWFQSMIRSDISFAEVAKEFEAVTREENQRQIDKVTPEVRAVPRQPETAAPRRMLKGLFGKDVPPEMEEAAAHADRFSVLYKWGLNLVQVAKRNWWIKELQAYREDVQRMHIETQRVMAAAHFVLKQLRKLGKQQEEAVYAVMHDLDQMEYRTPKEKADEVSRNPSPQEFDALVKKHKLNAAGLRGLDMMRKMFDDFLGLNEANAMEVARRTIQNPVRLSEVLDGIRASFQAMRNRPYFPHMQFGEHTVVIRNAAGKVVYLETVDRKGFKSALQVQKELFNDLKKTLKPGETIQMGKWERDVKPLVGMPKAMLDVMAEKMDLTDNQRDVLDQLRFDLAPAQSFRHRFQRRKNVKGYSMDFRRAFATYFFHGAHFYAKSKYMDLLEGHIKALHLSTRLPGPDGQLPPDVNKRMDIVNFLHDHKREILDIRSDWAALRAFTFIWALGYSPFAAALNATQLLVGSYPFLGGMFGDAKAVAAITKAGTQISTFYKKGRLTTETDADMQALNEAVKDGTVTEAMAPELAATANGNNLLLGIGGNAAQRGWMHFMEKGAFMFEMIEQMNRRITFRAAWDLALKNPNAKFVRDAVAQNPGKMARLMGPTQNGGLGWTEAHAMAYVAAKEAVESTQYVYAPWARPRMFRGKLGTIFMFKTFIQNTLFMLWNYPTVAVRSLLVMGFMGGLMGLPGGDDIKEIMRVLAWHLFGKDFNIEIEARRLIKEMSNGTIPPDLLLHGMARRGMGIPTILDLMGNTAGHGDLDGTWERFKTGRTEKPHVPFPITDMSRSVGLGQILPIQLGELLGPPNKDQSKVLADQIQRASGAAFGIGFNLYKAVTDAGTESNDPKRWERTIPRAFAAVSKSMRIGAEGRERTRTGATLQNYDINDTEQLAELVAMGLGFQPLRQTAQWDRIIAEREAQEFLDISRGTLLRQYFHATQQKDPAVVDQVRGAIQKFNQGLPDHAKGKSITAETLKSSLAARARSINAQESGTPVSKRAIGVAREIQDLFPESTVDVRRVPSSQ